MPVINVDRFNAFSVNAVGLHGTPFPLSISIGATEGIWTVTATAARACDLVDTLLPTAGPTALVLNVDQTSWLDDDYTSWTLERIAREQHVDASTHDVGWAASPRILTDDMLVMPWRDLHRFLDGWSLHSVDIVDVAGPLSEVDDRLLTIGTHRADTCLLPVLPGSRIHYSGHDDCYLYIETTDSTLPARILTRLLTLLAGSATTQRRWPSRPRTSCSALS